MDLSDRPSAGAGRGGRRRRRRRRGGRNRNNANKQNQQNNKQGYFDPDDCRLKSGNGGSGARFDGPEELNAFNLFCAYHLGVTRDDRYNFQPIPALSRRFGVSAAIIKDRLTRYGLQTEELKKIGFDAKMFQKDIQVAPEGVSKIEIARSIWEEFVDEIDIQPDPDPAEDAAISGVNAEQAEASDGSEASEDTATDAEVAEPEAVEAEAEEAEAAEAEEAEAEEPTDAELTSD